MKIIDAQVVKRFPVFPGSWQIAFGFILILICFLSGSASQGQKQRAFAEDIRVYHLHSRFLPKDRQILIWLPPGYATEPSRRYPVLYMHDGNSVFVNWRIDETAKLLIAAREIEPLIIVMVPNGGTQEDRFDDYTPTRDSGFTSGGKADAYGRMLIEEAKPTIDSEFRTLTDSTNTAIGGASLGGLVSLYLGLQHPTVFGKVAASSASVWWDRKVILRNVKGLAARPSTRIWLDIGSNEGEGGRDMVKELRDALVKKGWVLNSDLAYFEAKGGGHNEESFGKRTGPFLKFLFPPSANHQSQ